MVDFRSTWDNCIPKIVSRNKLSTKSIRYVYVGCIFCLQKHKLLKIFSASVIPKNVFLVIDEVRAVACYELSCVWYFKYC